MCQNFETCYSTLSNMRAYGRECQNFYAYFIQFSSLLPTHFSSDNKLRVSQGPLQVLDSAAVLSSNHFNTALVPSVVECLGDAKQPIHDAALRFLLMLMQVFSPSATPHLCLESQELGLMDLPPLTHLGSLIWDGFDGSLTPTHHSHKSRVWRFWVFFLNHILMWCIYYFNVWDWRIVGYYTMMC